jgi:hypothetical protein
VVVERFADLSFRPARAGDGPALSELAVRAKSYWGYDDDFLEAARRDLTITADTVRRSALVVLQRVGTIVGFYGLVGEPPDGRLEWMFLTPEAIGHGCGRLMWDDAIVTATALGFTRLIIESDRYAEPFYLAMGAERIGATPSPVDGAPLPVLEVHLPASG